MINCARCGEQTTTEYIAGKQTKNCRPCRGIHNIKNKRILKAEKMPDAGFYKQEKINYINNEPKEEPDNLTDDLEDEDEDQPEDKPDQPEDKPDQPEDQPDQPEDQPEDKPEQNKPDKTIKELLTDIFNKLEELENANANQIKKQIDLTETVFIILNKLIANENQLNGLILKSSLTNYETNTAGHYADIIKQQELKNKIVINKLDTLIKAVT